MKVAILSDGIFPATVGGIQRHTRLLVETLAAEHPSVKIIVLHPHGKDRLFPSLPSVEEVPVEPRPGRRIYATECHALSDRMATVVSQIPDAVVYAQGLAGWAGAKTLTDRLIVNPHGLEPFQCPALADRLRNWPLRVGLKHCFRHARAVISLGGSLTEILSRHVPEPLTRVVTIPNGVEIPMAGYSARAASADRLRILFVGRFAKNKGIQDLLKAINLLEQRGVGDRLQVDLVGSGPLLAELSARAPSRIIRYHGSVADSELHRLYNAADVFVLPTHFEGMPTVVLEAMARGLPIIVSEVGATCELVDASNGFLIPPSNPLELAARIEQCLRMAPGELQTLGRSSFAKATARFSWSEVARKHVSLFERVSAEIRSSDVRNSKSAG